MGYRSFLPGTSAGSVWYSKSTDKPVYRVLSCHSGGSSGYPYAEMKNLETGEIFSVILDRWIYIEDNYYIK